MAMMVCLWSPIVQENDKMENEENHGHGAVAGVAEVAVEVQQVAQPYMFWYQSKTIRGTKNVPYDAQLCPIIVK
jgi:hypothetical protein